MSSQPYIPLYIGDWERDTNCLSPLAEFALLKLTFKLFSAQEKGVFFANFRTLSVLFKTNLDETKQILQELIDGKILDFEEVEQGKYCIKSRRMLREGTISKIRSESGKIGGRGNKANAKQNKSKTKAKVKQNTDNDIDINNTIDYLNIKCNRDFSLKTEKSRSVIKTRLSEGFTLSDFKLVIDFKTNEWLNDSKMSQYLQPSTLFGNKFEGYLQACKPSKKNNWSSPMTEQEISEQILPPILRKA